MYYKIAFSGKMRSGKDTAVNYMLKNFGGVRVAFADILYGILHFAQKTCGFDNKKDRKFLQFVGTEWARSINPDVWIDAVLQKVGKQNCNIYLSDLRFLNEYKRLKQDGWILIRINRSDQKSFTTENDNTSHKSECELDTIKDWDYVINNSSDLKDFHHQLENVMSAITTAPLPN